MLERGYPVQSLISARAFLRASHIFSQFMNDQGSGPRVTVSIESSLLLDDEKRSKSKQNAKACHNQEILANLGRGYVFLKLT